MTIRLPRSIPGLTGRTVTAETGVGSTDVFLVLRQDGEKETEYAVTGDATFAGESLAERSNAVFTTVPTALWHARKEEAGKPAIEALLTPGEVATLFRVDPKTVTRWADEGKLDAIRTLGGHRRYSEAQVHALLAGGAV